MNFIYILLLINFLFISCENKKSSSVSHGISQVKNKVILLSSDLPECKDTVTLSKILDDVFYIALDLDKNTDVQQLYYTDSFIVINDLKNIYLFNHSGKKMNQFPLFSGSCDFSPKGDYLYTYSFLKKEISKYGLKGNKIWSTKLKNNNFGYYGYFFSVINDTLFAISSINEGYNKDQLIFVNEKGHVIERIHNYEQFTPPKNSYSFFRKWYRSLSKQNNNLYYHPFYNDTLFIIKDKKLQPFAVEKILKKVPLNHRIEYTGESPADFSKYCKMENKYATRFYNSTRYLIVEYRNASINYSLSNYLIYDKKNKTLSQTYNDLKKGMESKILHFGIFNDWDGGLSLSPSFLYNNHLIMVNAGEMQGVKGNNTRELYQKGKVIKNLVFKCKSDVFINNNYYKKANDFFRTSTNEDKLILMIGKLKSK